MATIKVLTQLEPVSDRWRYKAIITHKNKTKNITGIVDDYKTQSQIKKAIIADAKTQTKKYTDSLVKPKTKVLNEDNIFKNSL